MRTITMKLGLTLLVFAVAYWLIAAYDNALGDVVFFDGWILAAAMAVQFLFHLKKRFPSLLFAGEKAWQQLHIYVGYFVVLMFVVHTQFSIPDTGFEWAIGGLFGLVAISGVFGTFLIRAVPARLEQKSERLEFEKLEALRAELAQRASSIALATVSGSGTLAISNLYENALYQFFKAPKNMLAHLQNSRRPLKRVLFEIDRIEHEADCSAEHATALAELKHLAEAKDQIDFLYAHERVLKSWLLIHVPATYGLVVLTVLHVAVVYAYRTGG